jgi:peptide/nickel transport system substrate-binding protein
MFEGLYSLDENLNPIPMLAADLPEISDDKLVYTIKLRPGLKFCRMETSPIY